MGGRGGDLPWLCHCHPGVLPSWLLTIISQTQTVWQTSKRASPQHHPAHLQGKGPFLILPGTAASQLQPQDNSVAHLHVTGKRRGMCLDTPEILVSAAGREEGVVEWVDWEQR